MVLAFAGLLLLAAAGGQAFAAAPRTGTDETTTGGTPGIPFTFADLGWLIAGIAALIVLLMTLQLLARRPAGKPARTAVRQQDATSP